MAIGTPSLDRYLQEINHESGLSPEMEAELASRIQAGDSRALDRLVRANLKFVISIANQYTGHDVELEDLINEGNIGLIKAAYRFDGRPGSKFATFAVVEIRRAIEAVIEDRERYVAVDRRKPEPSAEADRQTLADMLTQEMLTDMHRVLPERELYVMQQLYGIGGPHLTMRECAQEMGVPRERVRQIRNRALRRLFQAGRRGILRPYL